MMKTQILLFILLSVCLNTFTQALVPAFEVQNEDIYEFIDIQAHEQQTALAIDELVVEVRHLVSTVIEIRKIVPENNDEKIRVMDILNQVNLDPLCVSCQSVVGLMKKRTDTENFQKLFESVADTICEKHLNKTVCLDAVSSYGSIVFAALMDKTFNSTHICQRILFCPRTDHKEFVKEYVEEVLKDKPATNIPTPTKRSTYTVLHLTDPHLDLQYQEGSSAFCTEPLCCRSESGAPPNASSAAQYWGTLADCDVPMRTFDQFLQFTSTNFDIDMIFWTGDNIAHDIWHQNADNQTVNTYQATQEIIKYFPKTPIYPMFGNHEAFPADQFDFIGNGSNWLTSSLADMWKIWLDENATNEFRQTSFYSTVNTEHNVKIIALDTVACDTMDFYLLEDPTDPHEQLAWLRTELYDSEAKNQSVFIMGHIPPGDFGCDSRWSARYRALVDRFTNIIRAQFFGHTHNDQLQIVRSYADNLPVGVVYIAPSFTTYSYLNPSFRIFEVDTDTNSIINYYQYRLDLDKWNQVTEGPIAWDLAYDVLAEYNMADASFVSFDNMVESIKQNSVVAQTYVYNFMAGGKPKAPLSDRDLQHYYCEAKHSVSENAFKCLGLNANIGDLLSLLEQIIPGGWTFDSC